MSSGRSEVVFRGVATESVDASDEVDEILTGVVQRIEVIRTDVCGCGATIDGNVDFALKRSQAEPHGCLGVEDMENPGDLGL